MSIEVQKAPIISQIVLDKSNNDLQFSLDENGVITNSASKKATSKFNKTNDFLEDNYGSMASKYSDGYDSYDDDFEDDSPARKSSRIRTRDRQQSLISETRSDYSYTPSPPSTKRNKKNTANTSRRNSLVSYRSAYGPSRATNKPKKTKKSQSANSRPSKPDDTPSVVKKILSANRNKITKLYNIVEELQQEVDNLHQENRTLKRINVKQERELKRVDRDEGSLPQLLQRHSAELRTYRERLKKNKQEIVKKERESHSHDTELTKLRDKLHHYKELDSNKKLEERATLAKKLEKVEKSLAERDSKILELQKTIKLTEKARQREIKEQQDRYKKAKEELVKVQENVVSLREKLKEKEKQLDMTNIYHQNIQRKMKKVNPLALPATYENEISTHATSQKEKRVNVFLTNDVVSDTSSNVTAEPAKVERKSDDYSLEKKKKESLDKSLELEKLHEIRLKEQFEREEKRKREEEEGRLRREEEDRLSKEEEKKRMEERQRKEEEELKELRRRREAEERKRKEQERLELERKKREEEERIRKEKEEQARLKFQEDEETRRKKDLLLARMKAIDSGQGKPNGIIDMDLTTKTIDEKPKKLPIFLQSSEKPKETTTQSKTTDNEKHKFGSSTSIRSKQSKESSHEVKESFENLHHGLPAHPSDQHFRGRRNSLDDDLTFGSYKPTVGRRGESNKKNDTTFGSYNPSFGEARKHSGLDFSSKADKKDNKKNDTTFGSYNPSFGETRKHSGLDFSSKADKKDKSKDIVFGSYEPTLTSSKTNQPKNKENDVGLDFSSKRNEGRRPRANQPNSTFGDDLFNKEKPKKTSIFDDNTFGSPNTSKDKGYPWEKKVNVSAADKDVDSLLPRRPKLNQSFNQGPKQSVPAVGNMLNGTYEDDIEEMTL